IEPGFPCGRCFFCKTGRYNLCPDVVFVSAPPINGTFCDYLIIHESFAYHMPSGMSFE
ncbi:MAG: alcohol dehydrogenase catalytic domain-containing protein, partial [Clostridiales bacterium]|nr:alcohol dehydrogenase catalytic domain-containing protein [Clostridiales bacterium]